MSEYGDDGRLKSELASVCRELVLLHTGAARISSEVVVQSLWSGYGQIVRLTLDYDSSINMPSITSVIVKQIRQPTDVRHPRGWDTDVSNQRKIKSYQVEKNWYECFSEQCRALCAMPRLIASEVRDGYTWLILEDLDTGYPLRYSRLTAATCIPCVRWLARFHGIHLGITAKGLWSTGSYWHLQTRQDEFDAMIDGPLKEAALQLNQKLEGCSWKTVIHGDAKVANICFSGKDASKVAFVDFQYTGGGCGMRDLVYLLGSCLTEQQCEQQCTSLLDEYFVELADHLPDSLKGSVEEEWRGLYATAWADFHRFLAGWMPGHKKINRYMQRMTELALIEL